MFSIVSTDSSICLSWVRSTASHKLAISHGMQLSPVVGSYHSISNIAEVLTFPMSSRANQNASHPSFNPCVYERPFSGLENDTQFEMLGTIITSAVSSNDDIDAANDADKVKPEFENIL